MNNVMPQIHESPEGRKFITQPHEVPCFKTKHAAYECVNFLRSKSVLKWCGQIYLDKVCMSSTDDTEYFVVACREGSFGTLKEGPMWNFYGCHPNCHCYVSLWKMKIKARVSSFVNSLRSLFRWFSSLPWQTQLLIIFLIILALAPRWVNPLLRLIEGIKK
jgi:hypothetical protein